MLRDVICIFFLRKLNLMVLFARVVVLKKYINIAQILWLQKKQFQELK